MRIVTVVAANERHYRHTRFKTAESKRKFGKENEAGQYRGTNSRSLVLDVPIAALDRRIPFSNQTGMGDAIDDHARDHEHVARQIKPKHYDGDRDHLFEAA